MNICRPPGAGTTIGAGLGSASGAQKSLTRSPRYAHGDCVASAAEGRPGPRRPLGRSARESVSEVADKGARCLGGDHQMNKSAAFSLPVLALFGVFGAGRPAWAVGGTDTAGCYAFSDTIAPRDANAPTFSFTDISTTGTQVMGTGANASLPLGDDDVSGPLPIGFPFNFYGTGYSQVFVSSNGFLSFLSEQGSAFHAAHIPSSGVPNAIIAGLWTDLAGGKIYYQTLGTTPNRRFIVQFDKVSFFLGP